MMHARCLLFEAEILLFKSTFTLLIPVCFHIIIFRSHKAAIVFPSKLQVRNKNDTSYFGRKNWEPKSELIFKTRFLFHVNRGKSIDFSGATAPV